MTNQTDKATINNDPAAFIRKRRDTYLKMTNGGARLHCSKTGRVADSVFFVDFSTLRNAVAALQACKFRKIGSDAHGSIWKLDRQAAKRWTAQRTR